MTPLLTAAHAGPSAPLHLQMVATNARAAAYDSLCQALDGCNSLVIGLSRVGADRAHRLVLNYLPLLVAPYFAI